MGRSAPGVHWAYWDFVKDLFDQSRRFTEFKREASEVRKGLTPQRGQGLVGDKASGRWMEPGERGSLA